MLAASAEESSSSILEMTATNDEMAEHILRWLDDDGSGAALRAELAALRQRVAQPGACARTADYLLQTLASRARRAA